MHYKFSRFALTYVHYLVLASRIYLCALMLSMFICVCYRGDPALMNHNRKVPALMKYSAFVPLPSSYGLDGPQPRNSSLDKRRLELDGVLMDLSRMYWKKAHPFIDLRVGG